MKVSEIGLGHMGAALARSFLASGREVTVWNRTASKAAALEAAGAAIAPSAEAAVVASDVVVVCLLDYAASDAVVRSGAVAEALRGKTLIQLSTGTPADARAAGAWAAENEIVYLDGAIFGLPGAEGCRIFCSGPADTFERCRALLAGPAGEAVHVGAPIGNANALDEAILIQYEGILCSHLQAISMCEAEGLSLEVFESFATWLHDLYGPHVDYPLGKIRAGRFGPGDETPLSIWVAAIAQHARFAREAGIDPTFADALLRLGRKAMEAGHSDEEFAAVYAGFRTP